MANQSMWNVALHHVNIHALNADAKIHAAFLPKTKDEIEQAFAKGGAPSDYPTYPSDLSVFDGWATHTALRALLERVREKFNGMVDIYPSTLLLMGSTVLRWAVRPHNSNLVTALVTFHRTAMRFEITSLRVSRTRIDPHLIITSDAGRRMTLVVSDMNKAASTIASFLPYSDTEVAIATSMRMFPPVLDMVNDPELELRYFSRHWVSRTFDSVSTSEELVEILDSIYNNGGASLHKHERIMSELAKHLEQKRALSEKLQRRACATPISVVRSFITGDVLCGRLVSTRGNVTPDNIQLVRFEDFTDVPLNIQRAVMTLQVQQKDEFGIVDGLGVAPHDNQMFAREACAVLVDESYA